MTYILGSDHAGLKLGNFVKMYLESKGFEVIDYLPQNDIKVDYPDFAKKVCKEVLNIKNSKGVLICGTGLGMSIAANRYSGIRATLCLDAYMGKMARAHNDANVLCLAERISGIGEVESILEAFIHTDFEGGRHGCRIAKIEDLN
ncbi:ribose 5-phosphate isomerase B [Helicobacter cappadocius]|uniref:Ribose 5-phosphate isomerase B n=1 Tax=Helicobacter cappadocius TaxID=3063998 RepID=A0AA90PT11_9HELI|nr:MULTISPECIES: ribose 5-phosphate isomerase B [unclassified Helicobacter]MDO7253739.1 ribose 5-phosphate isomerase B [Helicobacter sp. faydin-H75]MDP2539667.1 ribose 5-phosphate isomerase B [Helicobacter sp. faydin-H76]